MILITLKGGDASEEEIGFLLRRIPLRIFDYLKKGGNTPVFLVLEEAEAYRMIGQMETKALKTLRHYGLFMVVICQVPFFMNEEITLDVFQNTDSHKWFRCPSADIAAIGAKDLQAKIDPWMIHHVEERERQRVTGQEPISTESTSYREGGQSTATRKTLVYGESGSKVITTQGPTKTTTLGTQYRPVHETYREETEHHFRMSDQERMIAIGLMKQAVGEMEWKWNGMIRNFKTNKPEDFWVWEGLGEKKAKQHQAKIKKKPPFVKPSIGESEERNASTGPKPTPQPSGRFKKLEGSKVIKPVNEQSRSGQKRDESNTSEE